MFSILISAVWANNLDIPELEGSLHTQQNNYKITLLLELR